MWSERMSWVAGSWKKKKKSVVWNVASRQDISEIFRPGGRNYCLRMFVHRSRCSRLLLLCRTVIVCLCVTIYSGLQCRRIVTNLRRGCYLDSVRLACFKQRRRRYTLSNKMKTNFHNTLYQFRLQSKQHDKSPICRHIEIRRYFWFVQQTDNI